MDLGALYREVVARLSGEALVSRALSGRRFAGPVRVLALGKAAAGMARGAARVVNVERGVVVSAAPGPVPEGLCAHVGSHPVPDAASEAAGRALLAEAHAAGEAEAVLVLLSGGGSALAAVPAAGLSLEDKRAATHALLRGGCAIEEINAVRKHLSALKGGQLGGCIRSRERLALVLCDIPSGEVSAVASGPTCADPTTWSDALAAARRSSAPLPAAVMARLEAGARGELAETPKPGAAAEFEHVLLASPKDLAATAGALAAAQGVRAVVEERVWTGAVERLVPALLDRLREVPPGGLLALAGEPTLHLPSWAPPGGRMQHLALLLARELAGQEVEVLCAGSDGRDGPTSAAGAFVDGGTARRMAERGEDLDAVLERFDAARVCSGLGLALPAFESGTNLCDLVLVRRLAGRRPGGS